MEMAKAEKPRPYWHVDLKWIFGLLLGVVLGVWLLLFTLWRVTAADVAIPAMKGALVAYFSQIRVSEGDAAAIEELRQKIAQSPGGQYRPLPGFPVVITEADLQLAPAQMRDKFANQISGIAEPLYYKGARGFAATITSDPEQQEKFVNDAAYFDVVTEAKHNAIGNWLIAPGVVAVLLLAGVIYFSAGFGRVVSPAMVLLAVAVPMLLVTSLLRVSTEMPASNPTDPIALVKGAFTPAAVAAQQTYLTAVLIALGSLVAAFIGRIVAKLVRKKAA